MELKVAIKLIEKGIADSSSPMHWADLGAGRGLFTAALCSLLPAGSSILAVDRDARALSGIKTDDKRVKVLTLQADFTTELPVENTFDGILMANALHFIDDKITFVNRIAARLKTNGRFILIEYDMLAPNPWVPWPLSFENLGKLAGQTGFTNVKQLATHPSIYNRADMYAAVLQN